MRIFRQMQICLGVLTVPGGVFPLVAGAQIADLQVEISRAPDAPEWEVEVPRSPESDIWHALVRAAISGEPDFPSYMDLDTGLEEDEARVFREIAIDAYARNLEAGRQQTESMCDDRTDLVSREAFSERLLAIRDSQQRIRDEAVADVRQALSGDALARLQAALTQRSYMATDVDIEMFVQTIDPSDRLQLICSGPGAAAE